MQAEAGSSQSITALTRVSTTATATITGHGLGTGMSVTVAGANEGDYNGTFTITVVDDDTFTYTVANSPTTPATGTITGIAVARPHHALPFSGFPGVKGPGEA